MQLAGYKEEFRAKVISEGIVGYVKKVSLAFNNNSPLNRPNQVIAANKKKRGIGSETLHLPNVSQFCLCLPLRVQYWPDLSDSVKREMLREDKCGSRWLSVLVDRLRILWLQTIPGSRSSAMIVIVFLAVLGNCQRSHVANLVLLIKLCAHFVQALEFLLFMKGSRENVSLKGERSIYQNSMRGSLLMPW